EAGDLTQRDAACGVVFVADASRGGEFRAVVGAGSGRGPGGGGGGPLGVEQVAGGVVGVRLAPVGGVDRRDATRRIQVERTRACERVIDTCQVPVGLVRVLPPLEGLPPRRELLTGQAVPCVPQAGQLQCAGDGSFGLTTRGVIGEIQTPARRHDRGGPARRVVRPLGGMAAGSEPAGAASEAVTREAEYASIDRLGD